MPDTVSETRSIVVIGSSGGGTATLGHTKPGEFVQVIISELNKMDKAVHIQEVIFISLTNGQGMDAAKDGDEASLFHVSKGSQTVRTGTLREMNALVAEMEKTIANDIELGKVDGLISVSCKPSLFSQTLEAAAAYNVPLAGTGGTSLSIIASDFQVRLLGNAGGSVATTPLTKAISFSHAFAKAWGYCYRPWISIAKNSPSWRSVLNSCLPAFWGVVLGKRILQRFPVEGWLPNSTLLIEMMQSYTLPLACSVVMANSRRSSPGVLIGAAIAGAACKQTILGGITAGAMVAFLEERLLYFCILFGNVPATMTNLLTTGFVGLMVAGIMAPVSPYLATATQSFRSLIAVAVEEQADNDLFETCRLLWMSLAGAVFCYGSKIGWYHSIFLPFSLVEMELGDTAVLGAMDQLCLVLVSAGICSGTWLSSLYGGKPMDVSLVKRGALINLLCGDFIEACYPLMDQSLIVSSGAYLASSCSVPLLSLHCKSSAYLPFPLAFWLADDTYSFVYASGVAFGISFLAGILGSFFP